MNASPAESVQSREIVLSRVIDAAPHLVFRAWTDADHLARWFGPDGFSITTRSFDFRPDGVWDFVMHGPDGTDFQNWVRWVRIDPPGRIEYRQGARADDPDSFVTTVTFEAQDDGGTLITLHTLFPTKASRDRAVEEYGAIEGGHQTLGRLAEHTATFTE